MKQSSTWWVLLWTSIKPYFPPNYVYLNFQLVFFSAKHFWYMKIYLSYLKKCTISITADIHGPNEEKLITYFPVSKESKFIFILFYNTGSFSSILFPFLASPALGKKVSHEKRYRKKNKCHIIQCFKNGWHMVINK